MILNKIIHYSRHRFLVTKNGDKCCWRNLPLWKSKYLSTTFCCISFGIYLYLLAIDGCPSSSGILQPPVGSANRFCLSIPVLHNHLLCERHSLYFHISNHRIPKCLETANIDFLFRARRTVSDFILARLFGLVSQVLHMNLFQECNWLWFSSSRLAFFLRHCERKIYHREVPAPKLESLGNQCCYNKAMTRDPKIHVRFWWQPSIRDITDEI